MNSVNVIGEIRNLGKLRENNTGDKTLSFEIGILRRGENKADYIYCLATNRTAERLFNIGVGTRVAITGKLYSGYEKNPEGIGKRTAEIKVEAAEILDRK